MRSLGATALKEVRAVVCGMKNESEKAAHPQGFRKSEGSQSWSKMGAGRIE